MSAQAEAKTEILKKKSRIPELSFSPYNNGFSLCADYSTKSFISTEKSFLSLFNLKKRDNKGLSFSLSQSSIQIKVGLGKKKNYWIPALEATGINIIIWAFDRYKLKAPWARISLKTIINNIKMGYTWDNNSFQCNQFEHPWHGAIQYATARANKLNFWQSMPYPFFSSIMWEIAMENNRPSTNDTIMSTLGGIALGELLFRIADLVIDESSTGVERLSREVLAFIINPGMALDRLVKGRIWRTGTKPNHLFNLSIPLGVTSREFTKKTTVALALDMEYLDALRKPEIKPYDYFKFGLRFSKNGNEKGFNNREIFSKGLIFGRKVDFPLGSNAMCGMFAGFEYVDTNAIGKISAVDVGYGLVVSFDFGSGLFLDYSEILSVVIFGGTSSLVAQHNPDLFLQNNEPFNFGKGPDPYYMGPGLTGKLEVEFGKRGLGSISLGAKGYWIHGILLTQASETLSEFSLKLRLDITNRTQLLAEYDHYIRNGIYRDISLYKTTGVTRLMYVFRF